MLIEISSDGLSQFPPFKSDYVKPLGCGNITKAKLGHLPIIYNSSYDWYHKDSTLCKGSIPLLVIARRSQLK